MRQIQRFENGYYNYKYKIISHKPMLLSIIRGLKKLNIKFNYNKITKNTKYILLMWCDKEDIKKITKYRNNSKYKIKKVISFPTASGKYIYDIGGYMYQIPQETCIDYSLVESQWVMDNYKINIPKKYHNKIIICPTGIELEDNILEQDISTYKTCMIYIKSDLYDKNATPVPYPYEIIKLLTKYNINYIIFEYGNYLFEDYIKKLKQVDFVIIWQNVREGKSFSQLEAWGQNKVTLVKYNGTDKNISPYLNEKNGIFFKNLIDLEDIIKKYINDFFYFKKNFNPYLYIKENFTDEITTKKILKLLN